MQKREDTGEGVSDSERRNLFDFRLKGGDGVVSRTPIPDGGREVGLSLDDPSLPNVTGLPDRPVSLVRSLCRRKGSGVVLTLPRLRDPVPVPICVRTLSLNPRWSDTMSSYRSPRFRPGRVPLLRVRRSVPGDPTIVS